MPVTRSQIRSASAEKSSEEELVPLMPNTSVKSGRTRNTGSASKALNGNSSPAVVLRNNTMSFEHSSRSSPKKTGIGQDARAPARPQLAPPISVGSGRRRLFPEDVDTDTQQPKRSSDHHKVLPLSPCPPKPISARVDKANSFCPADSAECILDIISNGAEKEHAVSSSHNKPEKTTPVKPKIAKRKSPRNHSSTSLSPVSTGRKVVRKLSFFDSPSFSISYLVSPPKPSTRKVCTSSPRIRPPTPGETSSIHTAFSLATEVRDTDQMPKSISMTETVPVSKACSLDTEVMDIDPEAESICGVRLGSLSQSEMDSREPDPVTAEPITAVPTVLHSEKVEEPFQMPLSPDVRDRINYTLDVLNRKIADVDVSSNVADHTLILKTAIQQRMVLPGKDTVLLTEILEQECVDLINLCIQHVVILPAWFISRSFLIASSFMLLESGDNPAPAADRNKLNFIRNSMLRDFNYRNTRRSLKKLPFVTVLGVVQFVLNEVDSGLLIAEIKVASWLSVLIESHFYAWVLAEDALESLRKAQNLVSELVDGTFLCLHILGQMDAITVVAASKEVTRSRKPKYWHTVIEY